MCQHGVNPLGEDQISPQPSTTPVFGSLLPASVLHTWLSLRGPLVHVPCNYTASCIHSSPWRWPISLSRVVPSMPTRSCPLYIMLLDSEHLSSGRNQRVIKNAPSKSLLLSPRSDHHRAPCRCSGHASCLQAGVDIASCLALLPFSLCICRYCSIFW